MASFDVNMSKVLNLEGGYQNDPNDSVNFCGGVNAGTKYGVSAEGYKAYFGKCPSPQTMMNLDIATAKQIAKGNYWDKLDLDKITNQSVANMMFDFVWGSGLGQISHVKAIANQIAGKTVISVNNNVLTDSEAAIINGLNQELFFDALKAFRIQFFNTLATQNPSRYGKYLHGWLNRVNSFVFVSDEKKK